MVHDLGSTAVRSDGESATDDLAERGQVGRDAEPLLRPAVRQPEPRHDLIEDEYCAMLFAECPTRFEEPRLRDYHAHVPHDRLDDDRRDLFPSLGKRSL